MPQCGAKFPLRYIKGDGGTGFAYCEREQHPHSAEHGALIHRESGAVGFDRIWREVWWMEGQSEGRSLDHEGRERPEAPGLPYTDDANDFTRITVRPSIPGEPATDESRK